MQISRQMIAILLLLVLAAAPACRKKQDGAIEGTVVPPGTPARITAIQDNKDILTTPAAGQDGKFKLTLAAGTYGINVSVPSSPYPLHFNDIVVKPGETTMLPPIEIVPPTGKASLRGKVIPPSHDAEIKLIYEGKERAAVRTDSEGKYEFKELPPGTYVVQATAPGHADDSAQVVLAENQNGEQNAVLLPISSIEGVDWMAGKIHATGIGIPPRNIANATARREMAKRAALVDAQRNMLRTIELIRLDSDQTIKTAMRNKNLSVRIQGFLKGYTVISEREREDGRIEVVLELPLSGPSGLSRYITE